MRQSHAMQLCLGPEQLGVQRSRGVARPLEGCQLYSWLAGLLGLGRSGSGDKHGECCQPIVDGGSAVCV